MNLRIYGNRQLKTLPGMEIRPTLAKVREAVFNIWQNNIDGCRWLDICAGVGSMGAEALCRGASLAIAMEQYSPACTVIRQNWQLVASSPQEFQVLRGDVLKRLKVLVGQKFDLIYFDPPYTSNLYQPVLEAIAQYQLLGLNSELAVEHCPKIWPVKSIPSLEICRQKVYGNTALTFFRLFQD
ncbi:MAG: 16S rRNA (guanine(966)-N(2))-methyltransferase RsmD [Trichodesmium sp. St16_bin4-tuft]|nr:16S rRNA (guanine(966)-N(2))-methyltransferase RsmD [Trichodesmium sp. MAG_R01]MDE5073269.1 16S rRNA (guanine(966)-N(2))-methyltransferase RsmD [Trichodesmium sp. St5_bin8]MDE5091773.1 16S rRNA (guanine(966)-N(2))-methyltransferase RsmD [Trichodesmium sp. St18_bin3_1_1]MDE5098178.1 16S rRNA (guanine(966)-N(2))-methyltransferase RsmD [Trichodesmium sp. St16_bin4-tuft]MDE5104776.1 16S rRNA (guanine(966)-N(2))-methyltransferase RsmD [Trichodesmium sp. St19_bin2]